MKTHILKNRSVSERIVYGLVFLVFVAIAFSYLYVVFWCFYSGARVHADYVRNPFGFSKLHLRNFIDVFEEFGKEANGTSFLGLVFNSIYFSFFGSFLCILSTSMFAYVTTKYRFFGSRAIYYIVFIVILLPIYGSSSSMYKLLYNTKIINSRWMILTSLGGFSLYYMYFQAFYKSLSWTYAEAAQIDGANQWQIFFKVMFPQSRNMFGSLFLMLWISDWNNYSSAMIYLYKMPTLAVGIYQFKVNMEYYNRMDLLYAGAFWSLLPPLVLFLCSSDALLNNISLGGIKE